MQNPPEDHHGFIKDLNTRLSVFQENFSAQFNLQIPRGVIRKVDFYRDNFFGYLKDSVYKSNICYLLQLIDFQIWQYKLFRPGLSVENTYFYQLMITMGIVGEALCAAILLNPIITSDANDRSLGSVDASFQHLHESITHNSFQANIALLKKLEILSDELIEGLEDVRINVRNSVHIQGWNKRLYQNLKLENFKEKLDSFKKLIFAIKDNISMQFTAEKLSTKLYGANIESGKIYSGTIYKYLGKGGFGFIRSSLLEKEIYFHVSAIKNLKEGEYLDKEVQFHIKMGKKGLEASDIVIPTWKKE